ncbi:hypothetical protein NA57DRAFT_77440 [Rhizodiscina lignyota]|uniref:Uncharacterized protein n=1 Tax=Rhizodiscina lignyota TaxID=1504668 RepID=A0A9P4IFC5_9PEZI|nr:hypothetical protein NA57DRAFT_77440 [Rhizodiscina lignyota]
MSNTGEKAGDAIKKAWGVVHGAGETIRGDINSFADSVTGTDKPHSKNHNIAARGIDEMETGRYHGTGAGVTPADTAEEKVNRTLQGETGDTGLAAQTNTGLGPQTNSGLGPQTHTGLGPQTHTHPGELGNA